MMLVPSSSVWKMINVVISALTQVAGLVSDFPYFLRNFTFHQRYFVGIDDTNQNVHFVVGSWG